jgi:hypothetical protein
MSSLAEVIFAGGLRRHYPNIARLFPTIGSTCFAVEQSTNYPRQGRARKLRAYCT